MIRKTMIFIGIFLSQLFLSAYSEASQTTYQKVLPPPFCYFENLYLDTAANTFYALGTEVDPDKALAKIGGRSLSFQSVEKLPDIGQQEIVIEGTTLFMFEFPESARFCNHFFHLLEHVVGQWSFNGHKKNLDVKLIVLPTHGNSWRGPNEINFHLLTALFPNAKVQEWDHFISENRGLIRMERVMSSDRSLTLQVPECTNINKHLGAAFPFLSAKELNQLALRVNEYAGTQYTPRNSIAVTYLKRPMPRALESNLENRLLQAIADIPGVALKVIDFASISFKEQINIIGNTDILISVHGNGLSHILFLPATAAAIEILPLDSLTVDYMLFAHARNIKFLEVISNRGVISKEEAFQLNPSYGSINSTIYHLDIEPILSFIQQYSR
jgi:glycosyl transferase family 61